MSRPHMHRPSPATVLALIALVFAAAGSAGASPRALISKLTPAKVKRIAKREAGKAVTAAAPRLSVRTAKSATSAKTADTAQTAGHAGTADSANTAASAKTAGQAESAKTADSATTAKSAETAVRADSAAPAGPAGGALAGTFPNPTVAAGAIGPDSLADAAVTKDKLAAGAVGAAKLGPGLTLLGSYVAIDAGQIQTATVTCPTGGRILSVGYQWSKDSGGTQIISLVTTSLTTGTVRARVASGADDNSLRATAACLLA